MGHPPGSVEGTLRLVREWQPDVVYGHGLSSHGLEAAIARRFPMVLFAHGYYASCATGTKRHSFPEISMCRRRFGTACLPMNYVRRCGGLNPVNLARSFWREVTRHELLSEFRAVLVASRHMKSELARNGAVSERLHLVPLPSTSVTPDAEPPAARRTPAQRPTAHARPADDTQSGDRLIEAVPAVEAALGRSLSLIIGGTGPELERWRILAARRGVAAEFVGWVEPERRLELLRESDVLVVPSLWPEPFGLVGIEAGCVGVPSVGYAVGGIPDWLVPGETGELAPGDPPTTAGLAEAIVRALGDPTHHARLRLGAWQMSKRFRMEDHLSALLPQLESACRT